jgi:hypothetical protein
MPKKKYRKITKLRSRKYKKGSLKNKKRSFKNKGGGNNSLTQQITTKTHQEIITFIKEKKNNYSNEMYKITGLYIIRDNYKIIKTFLIKNKGNPVMKHGCDVCIDNLNDMIDTYVHFIFSNLNTITYENKEEIISYITKKDDSQKKSLMNLSYIKKYIIKPINSLNKYEQLRLSYIRFIKCFDSSFSTYEDFINNFKIELNLIVDKFVELLVNDTQ